MYWDEENPSKVTKEKNNIIQFLIVTETMKCVLEYPFI